MNNENVYTPPYMKGIRTPAPEPKKCEYCGTLTESYVIRIIGDGLTFRRNAETGEDERITFRAVTCRDCLNEIFGYTKDKNAVD